MLAGGGVRLQLQGGQHRAQEQPRAVVKRNEVGVLALPADPRRLGQRLLHQGRGVHEHLHLAVELGRHPAAELLQAALDQLVVVIALGIDGDSGAVPVRQHLPRVVIGTVVQPKDDRRAGVRPHAAGMAAALQGLGHPVHGPVPALLDEGLQPRAGRPRPVHRSEADGVEAVARRTLADQVFRTVRSRGRHSGRPGRGPAAGRLGAAGTTAGT